MHINYERFGLITVHTEVGYDSPVEKQCPGPNVVRVIVDRSILMSP